MSLQLKNKLKELFSGLRGFKFVPILVIVFKKIQSEDKTMHDSLHSNWKAEIIINESDNDDVSESINTTIISNV